MHRRQASPQPKPKPPATPIVKRSDLGGKPWKPDERRRVYVDPNDARAVTQTDSEIVCWNLINGSRLQTFRPEGKGMYVSPDAKVVATVSQDSRRVLMRQASTGRHIGSYEPRGGGEILLHEHEPAFTPAGDFLCLCVKEKTKNAKEAITAVSTRTRRRPDRGPAARLARHDRPPVAHPDTAAEPERLLPHPRGAPLLCHEPEGWDQHPRRVVEHRAGFTAGEPLVQLSPDGATSLPAPRIGYASSTGRPTKSS